jgi:tetratricopeptide (TPR) repeat protein
MALGLGRRTGYTLGSVYAWGVVGSIVGTFATGYVLIAVMETGAIIWSVAGVLALTGLCYLPRSPRAWSVTTLLLLSVGLAHADWAWTRTLGEALALREPRDPSVLYADESRYSHIEVRRLSGETGHLGLYLDRLLHSQISEEDPLDLHYGYARIFAGLTRELGRGKRSLHTLTIGGGGYVFPRYLEATWPGSRTEVVEIDPAVTRAAVRAFGLPVETSIISHHRDGRVFVNALAERVRRGQAVAPYDFVYLDAVNDYSVPHQLTTREFFDEVRALLASDGALLVNFIDLVDSGLMLGALASTLEEVFPHVDVFTLDDFDRMTSDSRVTFVLVGSLASIDEALAAAPPTASRDYVRLGDAARLRYQRNARTLVLTDDYAPVERLISPVVLASATEAAASAALARALELADRGELDAFVGQCREALRIEPNFPEAHYNLGVGLYRQGRRREALTHWQRAVAVKPDHAEAHFNMGALFYESGQLDQATRHLAEAVRLQPRLAAAHTALGIALEARGDLAGAQGHYEEALRLEPDNVDARGHLQRVRTRISASPSPPPGRGS